MRHWTVSSLDLQARHPEILHSVRGASRTIAILLPAGESLQDHRVYEQAHVVLVEGAVEVEQDGETVSGGPGLLVVFAPGERHEVRATEDARLLLILAPWPGEGHPGARD